LNELGGIGCHRREPGAREGYAEELGTKPETTQRLRVHDDAASLASAGATSS
jgi:hypothetical protein